MRVGLFASFVLTLMLLDAIHGAAFKRSKRSDELEAEAFKRSKRSDELEEEAFKRFKRSDELEAEAFKRSKRSDELEAEAFKRSKRSGELDTEAFKRSKRSASRSIRDMLAVPNGGHLGTWGDAQYCPPGSFAVGYQMKIEPSRGYGAADDDTALNGIRLICETLNGVSEGTITSDVGPWGVWGQPQRCYGENFLVTFSLHVHSGSGFYNTLDNTGANYVRFKCRDPAGVCQSYDLYHNHVTDQSGSYGVWSNECPQHTAICGLKTKVQAPQGTNMGQDDTALNDVIFYCCG